MMVYGYLTRVVSDFWSAADVATSSLKE